MRAALLVLLLLARAAAADTIRVDAVHASNSFRPNEALGAGIDRLSSKIVDRAYAPATVQAVLSAGWGPVSYRLNTELHIEAWHWNPRGTWSDPSGRGYFTGSAALGEPIRQSYGYPLPRRGYTRNEGTENNGFSRLTDGDPRSFWKSNPYLERPFTGEDLAPAFPQWIVIELDKARPVNALRLAWAEPFARRFEVQYWTGDDAIKQPTKGAWKTFPSGAVSGGKGGTATVALGPSPSAVRFVRILLLESSGTCGPGGAGDKRNCLGYALFEVSLGTQVGDRFEDVVHHSPDQQQTATHCSSVDPWHEPGDIQQRGTQTGFDLFYQSGVTRGLPAMIPVAVAYGIPEDAAAQLAYLGKRGYPISWVELGEEPDGQYMTPEHYAALYLQFATALHRVDPKLKLGGPVFEGVNEDIPAWPDAQGNGSWFGRFIQFLATRGRLGDLAFMSFEHYPFQPCRGDWEALYEEPQLIGHILDVWRKDGLPRGVPMFITEVNIAWQSSQHFVDIWGGLWLADYIGAFLTAGGAGSYFFHYLPWKLSEDCHGDPQAAPGHPLDGGWGTFALHKTGDDYRRFEPLAQYFASQLITRSWVQPGDGVHQVHPATSDVKDGAGHVLVTAYAVHRPDGSWAVLLVNKDRDHPHQVEVLFDGTQSFTGQVAVTSWGPRQYVWHPAGERGHASPARPPLATRRKAAARYDLPAASLTVLQGRIAPPR